MARGEHVYIHLRLPNVVLKSFHISKVCYSRDSPTLPVELSIQTPTHSSNATETPKTDHEMKWCVIRKEQERNKKMKGRGEERGMNIINPVAFDDLTPKAMHMFPHSLHCNLRPYGI